MKRKQRILVYAASMVIILLAGCQSRFTLQHYLHNATGQDIVVSTYEGKFDTIATAAYYLLEQEQLVDGGKYTPALNSDEPLLIYFNNACYQVDRNDANSCLWSAAYRQGTNEEVTQLGKDVLNAEIRVFDITAEYITSQILKE